MMKHFSEADWYIAEKQMGDVPVAVFKDWLELPESISRVEQEYGEDWTLLDALKVMWPKPRAPKLTYSYGKKKAAGLSGAKRSYKPPKDEEDETVALAITPEEFEARCQERVEKYTQFYMNIAPNDAAVINDLAAVEVEQEVLHGMMRDAMMNGRVTTANRIGYTLKGMSEQAGHLQKVLHIDRLTREREAERMSDADEVIAVIDDAGDWMEKHGLKLVHEGCSPETVMGESRILFGIMLWDFMEVGVKIEWICPRCNQPVVFEHIPSAEELAETTEPEWVEAEEEEFRTKEVQVQREKEEEE